MAIIILTIVYLLSGIGAYFLMRKKYSKGGEWYGLDPIFTDIILVFTPIVNTVVCILLGAFTILDKIAEIPSSSLPQKFFNLKNK
jgi:amino acid transporter